MSVRGPPFSQSLTIIKLLVINTINTPQQNDLEILASRVGLVDSSLSLAFRFTLLGPEANDVDCFIFSFRNVKQLIFSIYTHARKHHGSKYTNQESSFV